MEISLVQAAKLALSSATGLSKDALHVYVALAVMLATAVLLRKSLGSALPWLSVVLVAIIGELFDWHDDLASLGVWDWRASLHDLLNTVFWPSVILLLVRGGWLSGGLGSPDPVASPSTE